MKTFFFPILLFLLAMGLTACQNEQPEPEAALYAQSVSVAESWGSGENCGGNPLVLGEKLNNPYTLANMLQAVEALENQEISSLRPVQVRTTHLYVRFAPANWDEYETLTRTSAILFDHPLDYQILEEGNFYHDPAISMDLPTYQYATVEPGFQFPDGISREILCELYIPEEDASLLGEEEVNIDYVHELLNQAYTQTGNFEDIIASNKTNGSKFTPGRKIEIFDTRLNQNIGLEGVELRATRWFITYRTTTDASGKYLMSKKFDNPCNYSLHFQTDKFEIRDGFMSQAWINGPKIKGDWNHTIANGYDRFVGHVFRGAYRYHHLPTDGLRRPFTTPTLGYKNILKAVDADKSWAGINPIVTPIRIARYRSGNSEYGSEDVFGTVCHELAHTSHVIVMNAGLIQYSQVTPQLRESWCVAVDWALTRLEYKERGIAGFGDLTYFPATAPPWPPYGYGYNDWTMIDDPIYTNIYINLVDDANDMISFPESANDDVTGYSLATIESTFLKHVYGLSSLSSQLKANKPSGVTNAQIDNLLFAYQ